MQRRSKSIRVGKVVVVSVGKIVEAVVVDVVIRRQIVSPIIEP
jgi:hypothetical protein